jgi:osmotically-inducible protein OsmY
MKKNLIFSLVPFFAVQSSLVFGYYGQSSDGYQNSNSYNQNSNTSNQTPYNQSNDYYNQSNPNNQSQTSTNPSNDYYNQNNRNNSSQPSSNRNSNSSYDQNSQFNNNNSSNSNGSSYGSRSYLTQADTKDQTYSERKYPQDSYSSEIDRQINGKIREKITGWFTDSYKNISLNTNNGVVTISGFVNSNDDITKLVNEIRKIDGVRSVNSNVQIKQ